MGGGFYSYDDRSKRAVTSGFYTKSKTEIFSNTKTISDMLPSNALLRESCDSADHPNSLPIIIALDLTGSMGNVPHNLVKDGLPTMMSGIINNGIPDPQVLFIGVGDHECDRSPLQIGQFESSDALLDKWLTSTYMEGGGGGNAGESYLLAWYYAAYHTSIDSFTKRGVKGLLFTIGDEPTLKHLPKSAVDNIMGSESTVQYQDSTADQLLAKVSEMYNVYHIHVRDTHHGRSQKVIDGWIQLLGDNLIVAQSHEMVPELITNIVCDNVKSVAPILIKDQPVKDVITSIKPVEILL